MVILPNGVADSLPKVELWSGRLCPSTLDFFFFTLGISNLISRVDIYSSIRLQCHHELFSASLLRDCR